VHIHNTMDLTTALIEANKPFEHFIYPNKNHSIKGKPTSYHLYEKMTQFILNNL
jgi:dipeptidyl-peptidase 4